jgi:hypothetical protein
MRWRRLWHTPFDGAGLRRRLARNDFLLRFRTLPLRQCAQNVLHQ